jgi:hypothetical protein
VVVGSLCALLVVVVGWAGAGTIVTRFASADPYDLNGRAGPWKDAIRVVSLFPLAGTGFNTYDAAMVFHQRFNRRIRYLQAHNDYLQLAAEGGLLLTIPAIACLGAFVVIVRRRFVQETIPSTYWIRAGAVVGLLAIALQEIVDFSLQMPGNAFLFVVLCAIAMHRSTEEKRQPAGPPESRIERPSCRHRQAAHRTQQQAVREPHDGNSFTWHSYGFSARRRCLLPAASTAAPVERAVPAHPPQRFSPADSERPSGSGSGSLIPQSGAALLRPAPTVPPFLLPDRRRLI